METTGKCTNFASCTLAYRNEPIPYSGNPVCPECGQPLTTGAASKGLPLMLLIGGGAGALLLVAGGLFFAFHTKTPPPPVKIAEHTEDSTPPPSTPTPEPPPSAPPPGPIAANNPVLTNPDTPPPSITPDPTPVTPSTPPPTPITGDQLANPIGTQSTPAPTISADPSLMPAPQDSAEPVSVVKSVDTNIKGDENLRVRTEVLRRIELMPNLSPGDREKLYGRVDRAHGMGKVINIPFAAGSRAVGPKEIDQLKGALKSPSVATLVKDPTVVFVLLGFADKRGDEKTNQKISLDRAENISQTLKEKCGMQNVTQPVGMGGSALFDSGNFAKNRVVEVWAVVP